MTALRHLANSIDIGLLELSIAPLARAKHLRSELSLELGTHGLVVGTLGDLVGLLGDDKNQLTLLELVDHFLVVSLDGRAFHEDLKLSLIFVFELLGDAHDFLFFVASYLDPFVLHGLSEANLSNLGANNRLNICL